MQPNVDDVVHLASDVLFEADLSFLAALDVLVLQLHGVDVVILAGCDPLALEGVSLHMFSVAAIEAPAVERTPRVGLNEYSMQRVFLTLPPLPRLAPMCGQ